MTKRKHNVISLSDSESTTTSPNSKKPKSNKSSKTQPCDLSTILSKLTSIESSVKSVKAKVNNVVASTEEVKKSIADLKKDFEIQTTDHEKRICGVEELAINLQTSIDKLKASNEGIYNKMNELNLVVSGLPDSETETNNQLVRTVQKLIFEITKREISIDVGSRLGKFRPGVTRAVKVKFVTMLERNCVYLHRTSLKHPCYINEDLSPETRKDLALLRQKKKEILSQDRNATVTIDSKTKTLHHGQRRISIRNGIMQSNSVHHSNPNYMEVDFQTSQHPKTST